MTRQGLLTTKKCPTLFFKLNCSIWHEVSLCQLMQMNLQTLHVRGCWPLKKCQMIFFKLDCSNLAYRLLV
jgi:hypothetical protein